MRITLLGAGHIGQTIAHLLGASGDYEMTVVDRSAAALAKLAHESDALFVLTHNYTGYPMVRQAREMVAGGELGKIRLGALREQLMSSAP